MAKVFKELGARPSKIILEDGTIKRIDELTPEELDRCKKSMTARVADTVNRLMQRPEVAKAFMEFHPFYLESKEEWEKLKEQDPNTPCFHNFLMARMKKYGWT